LNKSELAEALAENANLSKTEANLALDSLVKIITSALQSGDSVAIAGFGNFSVGDRAARTGRNPQTGASMEIPARTTMKFKPSKT
jgi:DNA-binding protein HU-beta